MIKVQQQNAQIKNKFKIKIENKIKNKIKKRVWMKIKSNRKDYVDFTLSLAKEQVTLVSWIFSNSPIDFDKIS